MTTLGTVETIIRRSILQDSDSDKYSQERIWDAVRYALRQFVAHTALATELSYIVETDSETTYVLPSEVLVDDFENTAVVAYEDTSVDHIEYLEPVSRTPGHSWTSVTPTASSSPRGFYLEGQRTMRLRFMPTVGRTLKIYCYRYWPEPVASSDDITIPAWAELPIMYLATHHLLVSDSIQTAAIRQWGAQPDTGNPNHNPIMQQALFMLQMANSLLDVFQQQERRKTYIPGAR